MKSRLKKLLFFVFPQLRFAKLSFDTIKSIYKFKKKRKKMQLPVKLAIGSLCALIFIVITGFIVFPKMIKGKVKKMTALLPQNDIRGMFVKVPFGLDFNIYMFNVTNPMEVNNGEMPILREIGPFCYEEWKTKESVEDMEGDDTMFYNATDTFLPKPGPGCLSGQEMITMPHPLIMGMVNTLIRQKPGALTLANKAIKSIFENPASVFLTAKVTDVLFDSVTINCGVKDFAGKAVCSQLKAEPSFKRLSEDELGFSLLGAKNGTPSKRFKVYRGKNNPADLGRIVEFDEKPTMSVWPTDECNEIKGTDGTIFPTYLKKEDGLVSFAPDLCRSLAAQYEKKDEYMGIPVRAYSASLGDMSKNADEKCYCYTPETCLKKGLMDLYKCAGVPVYVSLPHFYDSDDSYLKGVKGLMPNKSAHEIIILFEPTTGSPVYAKKRLQFNMPMEPNEKVEIFNKLPNVVFPLFWVEEGVALNITYTKQLKDFFRITKSVAFAKWVILLAALGGLAASGYLFYKNNGKTEITPVHKVAPVDQIKNAISTMNGNGYNGEVNHGMDDHGEDKY